jgi:hypothetical protein
MAHPQNSPRGLHAKQKYDVGADGITFEDYSSSSALLDANSTALLVAGQVRVGGQRYIGANSTGFLFTPETALPSVRTADYNVAFLTDSTGRSAVMLRTTGTTWKYLNVTTVLPT